MSAHDTATAGNRPCGKCCGLADGIVPVPSGVSAIGRTAAITPTTREGGDPRHSRTSPRTRNTAEGAPGPKGATRAVPRGAGRGRGLTDPQHCVSCSGRGGRCGGVRGGGGASATRPTRCSPVVRSRPGGQSHLLTREDFLCSLRQGEGLDKLLHVRHTASGARGETSRASTALRMRSTCRGEPPLSSGGVTEGVTPLRGPLEGGEQRRQRRRTTKMEIRESALYSAHCTV